MINADDLPHEVGILERVAGITIMSANSPGATAPRACERPSKTAALMIAARIASSGIMPVFDHVGELLGIIGVDRCPESMPKPIRTPTSSP